MLVLGTQYILPLLEQVSFSAKMVFNIHGAIIFPVTQEHRTHKVTEISCEDDYKGNALAAMLAAGRIEIRYHKSYKDADVAHIMRQLKAQPDLKFMTEWKSTYQGRALD
jgi:hypothetical protein